MFGRIGRVISTCRTELMALTSTILSVSLALWKVIDGSDVARDCFPFSGACLDALRATPNGLKVVLSIVFVCTITLLIFSYQKVRESWRKGKIEPVGFFYDRVSDPANPDQTLEHSLVQVKRTSNGGLEYRGVGRRPKADSLLDYCWRAREAWVYRANGSDFHKLIFRTAPHDIRIFSPRKTEDGRPAPKDCYNVGVIEYGMSNGRPESLKGVFFDYTLGDDYLRRGEIELSPANDVISRTAPKVFDRFFAGPLVVKAEQDMKELMEQLEEHFASRHQ